MSAPIDPAPLLALADRCVQCGLCLPHCPTYRLDRNEAESPRGRIALARALADDRLAPTALALTHLDHCLGCRRCEAVCPAGVEYGALLLHARTQQRARRRPGWRQLGLEWLCARPRWLDRLLGLYRPLARRLPAAWRLLPPPPPRVVPLQSHGRVAVFAGCVGLRYEGPVRAALARLCRAAGIELAQPAGQTCCGALHAHAGDAAAARRLAAENRQAFDGCEAVLCTVSGCHGSLAAALAGGPAVHDALAFLADRAPALRFAPSRERIALHLPCTQHGIAGSVPALRRLLQAVPGLDWVELPDSGCCGAAGSHMLAYPRRAARLREPLLAALAASGATTLVSANLGCRLHLAAATGLPVRHPLEFLAEHLR